MWIFRIRCPLKKENRKKKKKKPLPKKKKKKHCDISYASCLICIFGRIKEHVYVVMGQLCMPKDWNNLDCGWSTFSNQTSIHGHHHWVH